MIDMKLGDVLKLKNHSNIYNEAYDSYGIVISLVPPFKVFLNKLKKKYVYILWGPNKTHKSRISFETYEFIEKYFQVIELS
jgi:hypothetical protein